MSEEKEKKGKMKLITYCNDCHKVLKNGADKCPEGSWHRVKTARTDTIKKCRKCGSTKNLRYSPAWYAGSTKFGDDFICKECDDKQKAEIERIDSMNYIIINKESDEIIYEQSKSDVDDYLEEYAKESSCDGETPDGDEILILRVEKQEMSKIDSKFFEYQNNRQIIIYDDEIYTIEEVSCPEIEYDGDFSIYW